MGANSLKQKQTDSWTFLHIFVICVTCIISFPCYFVTAHSVSVFLFVCFHLFVFRML
jgi:hypothetical protein